MRGLVALAESRESAAKSEIGALLEGRSSLFEKDSAGSPDVGEGSAERATMISEVRVGEVTALWFLNDSW